MNVKVLLSKPRCHTPGFSLDTGHRVISGLVLTVVAGAPRANHSGAVVLLKKESDASFKLVVEHTFYGPGLASSFGYDVAVVDLNGDGWETVLYTNSTTSMQKTPIINMHNHLCMALIQVAGHCRWSPSVLHEGWRCWRSRLRLHEPRRTLGRSDARPTEWHQRLDVWTGGGEHWRCQSRLV